MPLFPSLLLALFAFAQGMNEVNSSELADFELRDQSGFAHRLSDFRQSKLLVVAFLGVDCPLAKLYAPRLAELRTEFGLKGVAFLAIDPNERDSSAEMARYVEAHRLPFCLLKDPGQKVADRFGATRTPEVFVLDQTRRVRYRGRIDDQYGLGTRRPRPERRYLAIALEDLLAGRPVSQPVTAAVGCTIDRRAARVSAEVTYTRVIAPILEQHCVACHRPGQIGPFSLTNYEQASRRARNILVALEEGRMPPWHADPRYGKFANDVHLTDTEKERIRAWVESGCPEGNQADPPAQRKFTEGWSIPPPDVVVSMPEPFTVPADGVVDYQFIEVDPGFREDKWVRAAEIRPGNRGVVHHCSVFLKAPGSQQIVPTGELGSYVLEAMAVGTPPTQLSDGMAKLIPAGSHFVFVIHYAPIGTVQTDRTAIGLVFLHPGKLRKEVATKLLLDEDLCIPPHAADHRIEKSCRFPADSLLLSFFPHMHLRGKSFRYEADYPDGSHEILLSVPRYDFNWQNKYVLAEPKFVPAGTVLRCVAHYDNSDSNPNNPDPEATVRAGKQSWDEMFNGYFDFVLAEEDRTQPPSAATMFRTAGTLVWTPFGLTVFVACCSALLLSAHFRRRRRSAPTTTA